MNLVRLSQKSPYLASVEGCLLHCFAVGLDFFYHGTDSSLFLFTPDDPDSRTGASSLRSGGDL